MSRAPEDCWPLARCTLQSSHSQVSIRLCSHHRDFFSKQSSSVKSRLNPASGLVFFLLKYHLRHWASKTIASVSHYVQWGWKAYCKINNNRIHVESQIKSLLPQKKTKTYSFTLLSTQPKGIIQSPGVPCEGRERKWDCYIKQMLNIVITEAKLITL